MPFERPTGSVVWTVLSILFVSICFQTTFLKWGSSENMIEGAWK
ncbi:hypothetical protein HMPREF9418_1792 [Neisseria macacae ATCC 33926]|uniref:Uncharacterized protein n=1 Tax=Neisseria macacae ATCC 33926 TaxID=997348 RepID=A0AA36XK62_9NEIS|nr:hypothetical protein HMPREF9418_1792 [Neisseria macacae ATCC 33926]